MVKRSWWLALLLVPGLLLAFPVELEPFFQAIRQKESAGHPWSIFDNTAHRSYRLGSRTEAERVAVDLVARGHNLDLGLFQVNWYWQGRRPGLTLANVFDPVVNENIARTIFAEFYAASRAIHSNVDDAIRMAVGAYNNGKVRQHNPKYVNGVYRLARLPLPYADEGNSPIVATSAATAAAPKGAAPSSENDAGSELARWFKGNPSLALLLDWSDRDVTGSPDTSASTALVMLAIAPLAAVVMLLLAIVILFKLAPVLLAAVGLFAKRAALFTAFRIGRRFSSELNRLVRTR